MLVTHNLLLITNYHALFTYYQLSPYVSEGAEKSCRGFRLRNNELDAGWMTDDTICQLCISIMPNTNSGTASRDSVPLQPLVQVLVTAYCAPCQDQSTPEKYRRARCCLGNIGNSANEGDICLDICSMM